MTKQYRFASTRGTLFGGICLFGNGAIAIHKTTFRGFQLFYENEAAAQSMMRAAEAFPSFIQPREEFPKILDCGANIGVSMLEWKSRWPTAQVTCFEPDPGAFELLQLNVDKNDIPGVRCVRRALADREGTCPFYGEVQRGGDARGNSLRPQWGHREETSVIDVRCERLSKYLADQPVALLKLDIEGAEEAVLREAANHLSQVEALYVEVHECEGLQPVNSLPRIVELLHEAGFRVETEDRYQPHALPAFLRQWQRRVGARQTQVIAWRR